MSAGIFTSYNRLQNIIFHNLIAFTPAGQPRGPFSTLSAQLSKLGESLRTFQLAYGQSTRLNLTWKQAARTLSRALATAAYPTSSFTPQFHIVIKTAHMDFRSTDVRWELN